MKILAGYLLTSRNAPRAMIQMMRTWVSAGLVWTITWRNPREVMIAVPASRPSSPSVRLVAFELPTMMKMLSAIITGVSGLILRLKNRTNPNALRTWRLNFCLALRPLLSFFCLEK